MRQNLCRVYDALLEVPLIYYLITKITSMRNHFRLYSKLAAAYSSALTSSIYINCITFETRRKCDYHQHSFTASVFNLYYSRLDGLLYILI